MRKKNIALVAHDSMKHEMTEWVDFNKFRLASHRLICTGTTGKMVRDMLSTSIKELPNEDFEVIRLLSGPLGGDQQLGSMISEGKIDYLIFFWDPMQPQPHDVDVKALLRIAVLYNIPTASNRSSADHLISSSLFNTDYEPKRRDFQSYLNRKL